MSLDTQVSNQQNGELARMKVAHSPGKEHQFQKTSLLTQSFIPSKLKGINEAIATCIVPTLQPPSTETQTRRVFSGFGDNTRCECPKKNCQRVPAKILATDEHQFAQQQARKRKGAPVPSITMTSGRDMYSETFRELLQMESEEVYRLFDRYNQYEVKINLQNYKNVTRSASFEIPGIADARPAVKPGDLVFIRPHAFIPNPFHRNKPWPSPSKDDAPPPCFASPEAQYSNLHRAEIHAIVLLITRGKESSNRIRNGERMMKDTVVVSWGVDPHLSKQLLRCGKTNGMCTVRFVPSPLSHERALTAFRWFTSIQPVAARDLLFPSKSPVLPSPPVVDENDADCVLEDEYDQLNENQTRFVQMVVTRISNPVNEKIRPPMVLTGPAGTGKTKTLLVAILQTLKALSSATDSEPHILVCTPSHTACDVITIRLTRLIAKQRKQQFPYGQQFSDVPKDVFRLYDVSRGVETVPVEILPYTCQNSDGQFILPSAEQFLRFKIIVATCEDAHLLFMAGITNRTLRIRRQCIQSSIESKLAKFNLKGSVSGANQTHFGALFIDEAAQATEPETLIPLSVVVDDDQNSVRAEIALCGDPRQLSPNIYSAAASENLQRSLLERLLRLPVATYGGGRNSLLGKPTATSWTTLDELIEYSFEKKDHTENVSVFLNLSYRGHPSFLLMPSKLFYFDKLRSAVKVSAKPSSDDVWLAATRHLESLSPPAYPQFMSNKTGDWPMIFRGVKGMDTSMAIESFFGSNSWCNRMEANAVVEMIEQLVTQRGILTSSIGVMAAFRAQVVLIRWLLREKLLGNVNVGIVEDYQAVERDVIIVSLTRSSTELINADVERRAGLFHQHKRMNVALTRAENLLVVVGDPDTMMVDPSWASWLLFCRDHGLWFGAPSFEH